MFFPLLRRCARDTDETKDLSSCWTGDWYTNRYEISIEFNENVRVIISILLITEFNNIDINIFIFNYRVSPTGHSANEIVLTVIDHSYHSCWIENFYDGKTIVLV